MNAQFNSDDQQTKDAQDLQTYLIQYNNHKNQQQQSQHQEINLKNNNFQGIDPDNDYFKEISQNAVKGIVGLKNLANTSFMNSAIQCLSNVKALTNYFLCLKYIEEINELNPLGTKGELVKEYASLLQSMWCGNSRVVDPTSFKQLVEEINPVFKGDQKHDSQEFLIFLIDRIHEDLNRIKKKPYVEEQDNNGRLDFEVAKESWQNLTARNNSIITDLMFGQYKSSFECPNLQCKNLSIRFVPFITVELNIPDNKKNFIELSLYYQEFFHFRRIFIPFCESPTYKLKDFKAKVQLEFNLKGKETLFFIQLDTSTYQILDEEILVNEVKTLSDKQGLNVRELAYFEAQIPKNDRIFIQFTNEIEDNNNQKRSLMQGGFLVFGLQSSSKQLHLQVFKMLKHQFNEVLKGIELQSDDELQTFYKYDIMNKFYSLKFNSSNVQQRCQFCRKEKCDDCEVNFDDESLNEIRKRMNILDLNCDIKLVISWMVSPIKNIQISDLFDLAKQKAFTKELQRLQEGEQLPLTLQDCLEFSQLPRQLKNDNFWYCNNCQVHVQGQMSNKIYKAPKILILKLKRLKTSNRLLKQTSKSLVDFPIDGLDMSNYIINSHIPNDYPIENIQNNGEINKKPILYDLFAITNYYGGHCTAYAKNHIFNKWFNFDDSHVSEVKIDQVVSNAAYILFYELRQDDKEHQKNI